VVPAAGGSRGHLTATGATGLVRWHAALRELACPALYLCTLNVTNRILCCIFSQRQPSNGSISCSGTALSESLGVLTGEWVYQLVSVNLVVAMPCNSHLCMLQLSW
jgi:hypothetical protein